MRFLTDMGIPPSTREMLRELGHDVAHAAHLGMATDKDDLITGHARDSGMHVLTRDRNFTRSLSRIPATAPTVIILDLGNAGAEEISDRLREVLQEYPEKSFHSRIVVISPHDVRFRDLPIHPSKPC